jgi:hypothetical protein
MIDSSASPVQDGGPAPGTGSWWVDAGVAVAVFVILAGLRPCLPDGDGLAHAGRAIHRSFLEGVESKHILYAPLLRCVLSALELAGSRPYALEAFTAVSNLCGAIIYLLLARAVFPPLLRDRALARICALGTVFSFGVMNCCATIETYAPALTLDVALAALCLRTGLETPRQAAAGGVLFVLAVGVHAANVLILPFVLAVALGRRRQGWGAPAAFALTVLAGAVLLAAAVLWSQPTPDGGPNWSRLIPKGDPQPVMSLTARLGRAGYGFARTIAWLEPSWNLTARFLAVYAAAFLLAGLMTVVIGRDFLRRIRHYWWPAVLLLVLAGPFTALGLYYYPSDPERWLFLMPGLWLVLGAAWAEYRPGPWLSAAAARGLLLGLVMLLGTYNALSKLFPEARHNRDLSGLVELNRVATTEDDVVLAPSGLQNVIEEFVVRQPMRFRVVQLDQLMLEKHRREVANCQEDLRNQIREALTSGRRVFAFQLIDEGLVPGRGYPWAWVEPLGYTPEHFLSVLEEFHPEPILHGDADHVGVYRLSLPH